VALRSERRYRLSPCGHVFLRPYSLLLAFGRGTFRISACTPIILSTYFRGFPHSFQTCAGMMSFGTTRPLRSPFLTSSNGAPTMERVAVSQRNSVCTVCPTTNTARLSPRYEGKTRGCHCSHEIPMMGGKTPETC
jgi:hypothetical protein